MDTEDEPQQRSEQQPTIAGRALRALRAQPGQEAPVEAPVEASDEAPVEPAHAEPPVDEPIVLTKAADAPSAPAAAAPTAAPDVPIVAEPEVAPVDEVDEPEPAPRGRLSRVTLAALALTLVALLVAIVGLVVFLVGTKDKAGPTTDARTDALAAAQIGIVTLTSLDAAHAKNGLQKWLSVTTGDLRKNIASGLDKDATLLGKAKRSTVGTVVAAAVTDFDEKGGTATVIASVDIRSSQPGQQSAVARNRYRAQLIKTGGVWKVADLRIVVVQLS